VPSHNKSKNASDYTGSDFSGIDRNTGISARDYYKQTFKRVASGDKHQTVPSSKSAASGYFPKREQKLVDGAGYVPGPADKKHHKRPLSSETLEKLPTKLQCKSRVGVSSADGRNAASTCATGNLKAMNREVPVHDLKQLQKPKLPAQNLTIGTPFDLASHLDAARKKMRRDFDSDSVTVVRQSNEGMRLLQMRPEFNGVDTSTSSSADKLGDGNLDASPLPLCHTDVNCATRLGILIAQNIDQHVDIRKLEQIAKAVSHRLQHGMAQSSEREIVRRKQPILISTKPRSASNITHKLQPGSTVGNNHIAKVSSDRQEAGNMGAKCRHNVLSTSNSAPLHRLMTSDRQEVRNMEAKCRQNMFSTSNSVPVCPLMTSDRQEVGNMGAKRCQNMLSTSNSVPVRSLMTSGSGQRSVDVSGGGRFHAADNMGSSGVRLSVTCSTNETSTGSGSSQTVRRIIVGGKINPRLPDKLAPGGDSELPKGDNRLIC